jgi:hypothetical protein
MRTAHLLIDAESSGVRADHHLLAFEDSLASMNVASPGPDILTTSAPRSRQRRNYNMKRVDNVNLTYMSSADGSLRQDARAERESSHARNLGHNRRTS